MRIVPYLPAAVVSLGLAVTVPTAGEAQEEPAPTLAAVTADSAEVVSVDAEPFMRGINSFQLLYEKGRWWVVTIFWQPEYPDLPIPEMYLSTPTQHH